MSIDYCCYRIWSRIPEGSDVCRGWGPLHIRVGTCIQTRYMSVYLSICPCFYVAVSLSACQAPCLSVRLSFCSFVNLSVSSSVCLSIYLSVCQSVCLFVCDVSVWDMCSIKMYVYFSMHVCVCACQSDC